MALKRNLIANYLGQGWVALMALAFIPVYINYLGIEVYGIIGIYALLQAWLGLLDIGMTPTLGREMARFTGGGHSTETIRDLLRSVEIIAVGVAVLVAGGILLGSNWIATSWLNADTVSTDEVAQAFAIMGFVSALRFIETLYRSAIVGLQRQVLFNVVNSIIATVRGLGAVGVLILISPTIKAFFLWQGAVSIIMVVTLAVSTYGSIPKGVRSGRFSLDSLLGVWKFAGGMVGITILALLLTQVDKILLSKLLSLKAFGYYTLAAAVAGNLYILIGPIAQAFYPKLCELYEKGDSVKLADNYHKGAQMVSVIAGSAAIVMILYADTFLTLWTQDAELAAQVSLLLSFLMLGNLLNGLMWIPYYTQLAHGWTRLTVYVNIVAVLFIVPAIILVVPRYGAEGAALVWVVLNAGYCLISVQFMYRKIMTFEKWSWYREDLLAPLISAALSVGLIKFLWPNPQTVLAQLMVLGIASFAALATSGFSSKYIRLEAQIFTKPILQKIFKMLTKT